MATIGIVATNGASTLSHAFAINISIWIYRIFKNYIFL